MHRTRRMGSWLGALVALGLLVSTLHCGGDDGAASPPASLTGGDASDEPSSTASDGGGAGTVTPGAGGVVESADGRVRLEVPPGAVAADTTLTIVPATQFPDDALVVGGSVYTFGPEGIVFDVPITMVIRYAVDRVPIAATEGELRIHKIVGAGWSEAPSATIDAIAHEARAAVSGFSSYGVRMRSAPKDASTDADAAAPPVGTLVTASGFDFAVGHVRVDGGYLYWTGVSLTTGAGVKRRAISGGAIEDVASTGSSPIWGFAIVGTTAFLATEGVLFSVPKAGGTPAHHASTSFSYSDRGIASDGTWIYWPGRSNTDSVTLLRASVSSPGCVQTTFANASCMDALVCDDVRATGPVACTQAGADADAVCCAAPDMFGPQRATASRGRDVTTAGAYAYWTESSTTDAWVLRRAVDASAGVEVLHQKAQANANAHTFQTPVVASGRVYWFDTVAQTISSIPVAGGAPKVEATGVSVARMTADATDVFFTGASGTTGGVFRFPQSGGPVTQLASAT